MPFMKDGKRDYVRELAWEHKNKPDRVKDRAERNAARATMEKEGLARKGDGKDVGHVKALSKGGTTTRSNIEMQSRAENRSFARNADGSMKSEKSSRERK